MSTTSGSSGGFEHPGRSGPHWQTAIASQTRVKYGRIHLPKSLARDSQGSLGVAVRHLIATARTPQNTSYFRRELSNALDAFLAIQITIGCNQRDWNTIMGIARQIKLVLEAVRTECETREPHSSTLPHFLIQPLKELEQRLARTLEVFEARPGSSAVIPGRISPMTQGQTNMKAALNMLITCLGDEFFNSRSNITGSNEITFPSIQITDHASSNTVIPLGARGLFYGRSSELDAVVDMIVHDSCARIAILGPGGIGKSRLAEEVLNDKRVVEIFGDRRFGVFCEKIGSVKELMEELLRFNGLVPFVQHYSAQDLLLAHISNHSNALICFDNLDTVWDAETQDVEALLSRVSELSNVTLILTARGAHRPPFVAWSEPLLPPLGPLQYDAVSRIWTRISGPYENAPLELLEDLGGSPLVITLFASLSNGTFSSRMCSLAGWHCGTMSSEVANHPHTHHMASAKAHSRLPDDVNFMLLFAVICILPQGLPKARLSEFVHLSSDIFHSIRSSLCLLEECGLIFDNEGFLDIHEPIRTFVLSHCTLPFEGLSCLLDLYLGVLDAVMNHHISARRAIALTEVHPEISNITSVMKLALRHEMLAHNPERVLSSVLDFTQLAQDSQIDDVTLLSQSISYAQGHNFSWFSARLWQAKGQSLYRLEGCTNETLSSFATAHTLYRQIGHDAEISASLLSLGGIYRRLNQSEDAEHALQSALELCQSRAIDNCTSEAYALFGLASVHLKLDRLDEAEHELMSVLEIQTALRNSNLVGEDVLECIRLLYKRRRELDIEEILPHDTSGGGFYEAKDLDDRSQSLSGSQPIRTPLQVLRRRLYRSISATENGFSGHRDSSPTRSPDPSSRSLRIISQDRFVLRVVGVILPSILPLAHSPEGNDSFILIVVSILGRYTCYRRLCEAEKAIDGDDNESFGPIKAELLQHWGVMITVLAAILAMAITVFVAASGSITPISNGALLCLGISASAAAIGFMVCTMLIVRCWHMNTKQFRIFALGIYDDYCFFAIASSIPSLALLLASLFIMLCVFVIAGGAWPRTVITLGAIFSILLGLQYIVKAGEILVKAVRRGIRAIFCRWIVSYLL